MSKSPRTDAIRAQVINNGRIVVYEQAINLAAELEELQRLSQAREIQLREACREAYSVYFDPGENEPKPNTLGWDAVEKLRLALTLPPPPVVAWEDAETLLEAIRILIVGVCACAIHHAGERAVATEAVAEALKMATAFRAKNPK